MAEKHKTQSKVKQKSDLVAIAHTEIFAWFVNSLL
jgi:hypothetical protein